MCSSSTARWISPAANAIHYQTGPVLKSVGGAFSGGAAPAQPAAATPDAQFTSPNAARKPTGNGAMLLGTV